jgi:hypothetical protein
MAIKWPPVLERAVEIVAGYDTGVTLRQLFYRLVTAVIEREVTERGALQ